MKIGFDAKRLFYNNRGLGNYSRNLLDSLRNFYPDNQYHLYTPPVKDTSLYNASDDLIIREPGNIVTKTLHPAWRSFGIASKTIKDNLDIFHGLSHELPVGIKKFKGKKIVTVHDVIVMRYPSLFPKIDRAIYVKKLKHSIKNADIVIAICEQTKKDLIHFLKCPEEKIEICYQCCSPVYYENKTDLESLKEKYSLPEKFILNVGALVERKNSYRLIQAFKEKCNSFPHQLIIVGEKKGAYYAKMKYYVEKNGLTKKVRFLGYCDLEDLPGLYKLADLFCFPSIFEGFGIPIIEALFSGTPVYTSQGSCFPEAAGPGAVYVDPLSIEDMGNRLEEILKDETKRNQLAKDGYDYVYKKFHWSQTAKRMMEIYKK